MKRVLTLLLATSLMTALPALAAPDDGRGQQRGGEGGRDAGPGQGGPNRGTPQGNDRAQQGNDRAQQGNDRGPAQAQGGPRTGAPQPAQAAQSTPDRGGRGNGDNNRTDRGRRTTGVAPSLRQAVAMLAGRSNTGPPSLNGAPSSAMSPRRAASARVLFARRKDGNIGTGPLGNRFRGSSGRSPIGSRISGSMTSTVRRWAANGSGPVPTRCWWTPRRERFCRPSTTSFIERRV